MTVNASETEVGRAKTQAAAPRSAGGDMPVGDQTGGDRTGGAGAGAPVAERQAPSGGTRSQGAQRVLAWRRWLVLVLAGVTHRPAALGVVALQITGTMAASSLGLPVGSTPQAMADGEWWRLLTAGYLAESPLALLIHVPFTLVALALAERVFGGLRAVLAYFSISAIAILIGSLADEAHSLLILLWPGLQSTTLTSDPSIGVSGLLIAVTFVLGPLWRRRLRVLVFSVVILFLLYGGGPQDFYRLLSSLVGLGAGAILAGRGVHLRWLRSSHRELRSLLATVVGVSALGPLIAIFSSSQIGPLAPLVALVSDSVPSPPEVIDCAVAVGVPDCAATVLLERIDGVGPVLLALMPLVLLLVAALGLLRGRRFALWMAVILNVLLAGAAIAFYVVLPAAGAGYYAHFEGYTAGRVISAIVSATVPLAVAAVLLLNRHHFAVRASQRAFRRFWIVVVAALVALSVIYVTAGQLFSAGWSPTPSVGALLADLPERFIPVGFVRTDVAEFLPQAVQTRLLFHWTGPVFWNIVLFAAVTIFFDLGPSPSGSSAARMRELLRSTGGSSIGHMATWPGNSHWFSADGSAGIAYRVVNGIALTTGGPICLPRARSRALADFARFCYESGWQPCFYSLRAEDYARHVKRLGWASFQVGEEMVIDTATTFSGRHFQVIRTSINGAAKLGIEATWTSYRALSRSQLHQVQEISEQWVADKNLPEMGFTLGGLDEMSDDDVRLLIAVGPDDVVHGVTSWLPSYTDGAVTSWTLDVMRRRTDGFPRVMEFLIASAVRTLGKEGVTQISLAAAPLAQSPESAAVGGSQVFDLLSRVLEPAYGFRSLLTFKAKFAPAYLPLIVAMPDALALPAVARAIAGAYLPGLSAVESIRLLRRTLGRRRASVKAQIGA